MAKKNSLKNKNDQRQSVDISKQIKNVSVGVKDGVFIFTSALSINELAKKLDKPTPEIIKFFFLKGKLVNINTVLNEEEIGEICLEYGLDFQIEKEVSLENVLENLDFNDKEEDLEKRPPIVTIMGHVDHGKTTLLDTIRSSSITSTEAGGITQHIGAYQINKNNEKITFIDTPGHEAFTEMRSRGANITDIVILVVAADDGLKQQTEEAIDHALSANVDIIVFINKMDKEGANPEKVMSQLSEKNIIAEEWGGKTIFIKGSALKNEGINELLDAINLLADIKGLKANKKRLGFGTVLEAKLDKGYGPVASLLVQNGTIEKGDYIVLGSSFGKIRIMLDDKGNEVQNAEPSTPIKIAGLESIPVAGDKFLVLKNEKEAKIIASEIKNKRAKLEWNTNKNKDDDSKIFNIILKTDVQGSLEAIKNMISQIEVEGAKCVLVRSSTGHLNESDVKLARASNACIVAFNIRPNRIIRELADSSKVEIQVFDVIYHLKEMIQNRLIGQLDPIYEEEILGEAQVIQTWKHSKVGTIAGCRVLNGKIKRNAKARVIRDDIVVYNSEISTLQHEKDQITEIQEGKECGLTIKNFNDIKINDIIEVYIIKEVNQLSNKK